MEGSSGIRPKSPNPELTKVERTCNFRSGGGLWKCMVLAAVSLLAAAEGSSVRVLRTDKVCRSSM